MEDTINPSTTYLPRHAALRNAIGRRPLPWQAIDGDDVAVTVDPASAEAPCTLILTSDHDEAHIELTPAQVRRLAAVLAESANVLDLRAVAS